MLPPRFMFIELNRACNLRCSHCDYWRETDVEEELPDHNRLEFLISEFAALSSHGTVVTCGGEPMLRLDHGLTWRSWRAARV